MVTLGEYDIYVYPYGCGNFTKFDRSDRNRAMNDAPAKSGKPPYLFLSLPSQCLT